MPVYDRVKSRDIFDLMVLTRGHGYTLGDIFAAIDTYQPIRNKDPEHFKSVVTGAIALDKDDEGAIWPKIKCVFCTGGSV